MRDVNANLNIEKSRMPRIPIAGKLTLTEFTNLAYSSAECEVRYKISYQRVS